MAVQQTCRIIRIGGSYASNTVFLNKLQFFTDKRIIPGITQSINCLSADSRYDFFKMFAIPEDLLRAAELLIQVFCTYTSNSFYSV